MTPARRPNPDLDRLVGRLLVGLTWVSVVVLVLGVGLMLLGGISPLSDAPAFDPGTIREGLAAADPAAVLWLGILVVLVTPIARVVVAGVGFGRQGKWVMVAVAAGILFVIATGIVVALWEA